MFGTLGLAFLAGCVSVLSPCVIPLLPVVLGAAVAQHRLAPIALAFGLALSFTAVGIFVATIGFTLGIDGGVFRNAGAIVLALVGGLLLLPAQPRRPLRVLLPLIQPLEEDKKGKLLDRVERIGKPPGP